MTERTSNMIFLIILSIVVIGGAAIVEISAKERAKARYSAYVKMTGNPNELTFEEYNANTNENTAEAQNDRE